jgi:glutathione S-transferase
LPRFQHSRSGAARILLEELGVPYALEVVNPYLRWMAFYGSSFEPAVIDLAMKRDPAPPAMCPYRDYDTMLATLTRQLRAGPWLLGERFSAADILWAHALGWTTGFRLVPESPEIVAYMGRRTPARRRNGWRRPTPGWRRRRLRACSPPRRPRQHICRNHIPTNFFNETIGENVDTPPD